MVTRGPGDSTIWRSASGPITSAPPARQPPAYHAAMNGAPLCGEVLFIPVPAHAAATIAVAVRRGTGT